MIQIKIAATNLWSNFFNNNFFSRKRKTIILLLWKKSIMWQCAEVTVIQVSYVKAMFLRTQSFCLVWINHTHGPVWGHGTRNLDTERRKQPGAGSRSLGLLTGVVLLPQTPGAMPGAMATAAWTRNVRPPQHLPQAQLFRLFVESLRLEHRLS